MTGCHSFCLFFIFYTYILSNTLIYPSPFAEASLLQKVIIRKTFKKITVFCWSGSAFGSGPQDLHPDPDEDPDPDPRQNVMDPEQWFTALLPYARPLAVFET